MNGLLAMLDIVAFDPRRFPTVADVISGKEVGPIVIIHAFRKGHWVSTERVKASEVDWKRLKPEDHVETVKVAESGR
jgi:hypothetical protein